MAITQSYTHDQTNPFMKVKSPLTRVHGSVKVATSITFQCAQTNQIAVSAGLVLENLMRISRLSATFVAIGVLLPALVFADTACPSGSTHETCLQAERNRQLATSIANLAAARTADANATIAANKARFEFANSGDIKPNTGEADLGTVNDIGKWLAAQSAMFAAKAFGTVVANHCAGKSILLANSSAGFHANAAERARLSEELAEMARLLKNLALATSANKAALSIDVSGVGGLVQGLAAIAGFFVTDYKLLSAAVDTTDEFLQDALIGAAPAEKACAFYHPQYLAMDTSKIDLEIKSVRDEFVKLQIAINSMQKGERKTQLQSIYEATLLKFTAIFTSTATVPSVYTSAALFDSIVKLPNRHYLEIKDEVTIGAIASAVKRFSSGSYQLIGNSALRYRLIDSNGKITLAGTRFSVCRWQIPTKGTVKTAPICEILAAKVEDR